ncbi:TPA: hypothetical protein ACXI19_003281, partial [Proteus mirabilis]
YCYFYFVPIEEGVALSLSPMLAMTCFILDREHIVRIKNNEYHRFVIYRSLSATSAVGRRRGVTMERHN